MDDPQPLPREPSPPESQVWLVHGTWAHGVLRAVLWRWLGRWRPTRVAWPKMRQALEEAGCDVHDFVWSGRNSHSERLEAGEELSREVEKLRRGSEDEPRPGVFLVSHSHGGNVALYAARKLSPPPPGIVCLATPFLIVEPLALDTVVLKQLRGALSVLAFFSAFFLWLLISLDRPIHPVIVTLVGLAVAFGVGWLMSRLVLAAEDRCAQAADRLAEAAEKLEPAPPASPTLLLRKAGDEASAVLLTGQLAEWLTTRIWRLLSTLLNLPNRLLELLVLRHPKIAMALFVTAVIAMIAASQILDDEDLVYRILGSAILGMVAAVIAVAALQALLGVVLIVLNYARLGGLLPEAADDEGRDGEDARAREKSTLARFLAPLLLKITTESVPAGEHRLGVIKGAGTGGLAHSEIQHDDKVIAQVVRWIARQSEKQTTRSSQPGAPGE